MENLMRKQFYLLAAGTLMALTGSAFGEGKTPGEAISQNADRNGSFTDEDGYVTNGNVNFSDDGAMRSLHGNAADHASDNSAVDTIDNDPNNQFRGLGTRVEPRGTFQGD